MTEAGYLLGYCLIYHGLNRFSIVPSESEFIVLIFSFNDIIELHQVADVSHLTYVTVIFSFSAISPALIAKQQTISSQLCAFFRLNEL